MTWRKLKCTLVSEKCQCENVIIAYDPNVWHIGKCKTMTTVKRSVMVRSMQDGGMKAEAYKFLEQWNYSVWYYNGGHVSLHVYQNPLKVHCAML